MLSREIYKGVEIAKCHLGGIIYVVEADDYAHWFSSSEDAKKFIDSIERRN